MLKQIDQAVMNQPNTKLLYNEHQNTKNNQKRRKITNLPNQQPEPNKNHVWSPDHFQLKMTLNQS
jgi:hypothetical protein